MNIRIEELGDELAALVFDRPGANIFDEAMLKELDERVGELEGRSDIKGLILQSTNKSIFIAGADLHALSAEEDVGRLREMAETGQRIFRRLHALPMTKVAAIHGACLGGGYECTLACDYRLGTPDKSTRIGLPETSLGILPGWTGCTLLPRLIGVPKALDIVLNGRRLAAIPAKKRGMIDAVVPKERLLEQAKVWAKKSRRKCRSRGVQDSRPAMAVIRKKASQTLQEKTNGHYPAPEKALDLVVRTLHMPIEDSLREEAHVFAQLAVTDVSRNLVRLFFMQEAAKKKRVVDSDQKPPKVKHVGVIGAGVMGGGIAQWCSARGMQVILKDIAPAALASGLQTVRKVTGEAVKRRIMTKAEGQAVVDRILPAHRDIPMKQADVVIEAIVERMDVKQSLFAGLGEVTREDAVLASNTSALSVSTMAEAAKVPSRVCGIHFFNPVHRMALVEVVQASSTSPESMQRAVSFVQQLGKTPVVVQDRPGFVVNRVLMPYLIVAGMLHEKGVKISALDEAMLQFGMPMGPMRLMDEIGIDVCLHVAEFLCKELSYLPELPALLGRMVEEKKLGKKTKLGFYRYQGKKITPTDKDAAAGSTLTVQQLQDRMVLPMINEAARILDESIASCPEDVDLAMVLGTGFAPFTGGPLRYADAQGLSTIVERMRVCEEAEGDHFRPSVFLARQAEHGTNFYLKG